MPPLAILYDVHGNLPALRAVVADARSSGATEWVLGGDHALFGPFPAETLAVLQELPEATWIRGNVDRWTARPSAAPDDELIQEAIVACREALGGEVAASLGDLPEQAVIKGTRFCHRRCPTCARSCPRPGTTRTSCSPAWPSGGWCSGTRIWRSRA
jgi:hypothetical protein